MAEPGESDMAVRDREWYRRLVESITDVTVVLDASGRITYVSSAVEAVLGYDPEALLGDLGTDYAHPDDRADLRRGIAEVETEPASSVIVDGRFQRADGSWCWLEATIRNRLEDDVIDGIVVTARENTERLATKERMELALEGANLGIWDWNMETGEVTRDELLTEMLGFTRAEMGTRMRGWEELVHPAGKKRHDEALAEHVEERTPYFQCDHRLRTKSGEWKWVRTTGKVVERDAEGRPVRAVGIHQDVDDQKRANLRLEAAREALRQVIDLIPDLLFARNRDGDYLLANERTAAVFGISPEASEAPLTAERVPDPDGYDAILRGDTEVLESGEHRWVPEAEVTTADGETRVFQTTKIPFETAPTGEDAVLTYARDVTDLAERERALAERERTYRNLFEDTRDALLLLDRDGFFDCNERALDLFGAETVAEFVQFSPWDLSPPTQPDGADSKQAAQRHVERAFADGEAFFEWTHERRDGTTFPAEVKLSRFEHGGDPALHALVRDITDRKEYENRLERQRDNLEVLNRVLRHDIRNDIQLITAYAEMLAANCAEQREYAETILESAGHAVELTKTAREMADVMVSAEEDLEAVDLRGELEGEIEEVRAAYPDAEVSTAGSIPSVTVQANDMLESVFRNLLKNAIQHNDKAVPRVRVSATDREGGATVRIADNGPGVPDPQKEDVFGKGETGLDSQGTGLGLYLVQSLVESYGGTVRVEDREACGVLDTGDASEVEEPTGAVFVVDLPKAARDE
jgi:PAS domain S-box-containing protein